VHEGSAANYAGISLGEVIARKAGSPNFNDPEGRRPRKKSFPARNNGAEAFGQSP
jgi:hypothetical protein